MARDAAQLHRRPQERHAADGADRGVRRVPEVLGGEDALGAELERQTPPHAPDLLHGQGGEDFRRIVVGRAEAQLAGRLAVAELEVGRAHRDAERLELV